MKMDTLKDTVQSKTAVPTAQVYVCCNWLSNYLLTKDGDIVKHGLWT